MQEARYRLEVFYKITDPRGNVIKNKLHDLGYPVEKVYLSDNYLIDADISENDIVQVARLLVQPVIQNYTINKCYTPENFTCAMEIGFLPGVTDNVSHTVRESIEDLLKRDLDQERSVFSSTTYFLQGPLNTPTIEAIAKELHNPLIQRVQILAEDAYSKKGGMGRALPLVTISENPDADRVNLDVSDEELMKIAREGISDRDGTRRGPLALDLLSMKVIKNYFHGREKRDPTDVEMESIAQTWSEHCKHTIFAAEIDDISDGIYKRYIKEATMRIRREKGERDFCVSVFEDNSGGIDFDENFIISDKVETHNSPSALDPFGGAITGIVGVNRDAIGFGMAARPVANRYGFCFADPRDTTPLYRGRDESTRLLSPRRILEGVVHGVNVGGNTSGIPTPQGFVFFDERYKGKPLVFVGTVGLSPKKVRGRVSVGKKAMPGDCIIMVGGRVGRDGIHGATFSSEALSSGSPATAVQIGDPITQKKLSDAIVREARDLGLYNSITDNGAGGLSCSVAEMAREAGGFEVELERVPLKYPGLSPWQIWVSESQERMTLSVPENKCEEFLSLMRKRGVEATVIGHFNASTRGIVRMNGKVIFDLDMDFLHNGLPRKKIETSYTRPRNPQPVFDVPADMRSLFLEMLSRLNTASFEFISFQYDHEVQGNSVIKPVQGRGKINGNASVIRPLLDSTRGVVLSQGLYPSYSDIDTYWMAACSIDTAVRNAVAAGATLDHLAILDNFCWCDSNNPERLGELKRAAQACYDISVAYGTPFISGKDSMFNDFKGYDEHFNEIMISIPPTLLISSIGVIESIERTQTIDFKNDGDLVYVLGMTADETGGSEYLACIGERSTGRKYIGGTVPEVRPGEFMKTYRAVEHALSEGILASSISVERGGLAIALAKSAMAGMKGARIDLAPVPASARLRDDTVLFSESQGRVLVSVSPGHRERFEALCAGVLFACIGSVTADERFCVSGMNQSTLIETEISSMLAEHKKTFANY
ncbi:MAG TPA: phosphoribosylformylglycinamidine synthase subunit PurS [Spirochaetota bacterium]|nr:phosphoribosylformylglycinamidine synthase subunit PurS [Spirochaetota bacterium]HPI88296.1 phosphoribosylformylglycinamidine synthase subunit PurS [Spirochaetota bacterium]HPR47760.1 phosphoribosylformylglycinamidine synthase subunit PurS [Spirochaetota bacterium]